MEKEEYAEIRDLFTDTLRSLRDVHQVFLDRVNWEDVHNTTQHGIARNLDENGSWVTGDEYVELVDAANTLEALVGRAHERSVG